MNTARLTSTLSTIALAFAVQSTVDAQYAPPTPLQPFPGFINTYLRNQDAYLANWDVGGSVRLRYELRENNLAAPGNSDFASTATAKGTNPGGISNDNGYFADKVLFRLGYTDKWWGFLAEGRSSSVTSDNRGFAPNAPLGASPESDGPMELHQAYVTIGNHKEFPVSLKLGRQELSYGDERLVGAFGWNNIGRVFDGAKLRWQNSWFGVDAFVTRLVVPDDNSFNTSNDYEYFSGVYFNTKKIPKNWTEFYVLARNVGTGAANFDAPFTTPAPYNTSARDIYTIGTRLRSATNEWGNFDYTVEAAGQFGDWKRPATGVRANERDAQRAFAVSGNFGYTFADAFGTPRIALEYNYATGDSDPNDGTHGTFDNLYPTNHKFYGYMDLASWQNLHNIRAIFQLKPHPRVSLSLEGHLFWLADTHDRFYNVAGVPRAGATIGGVNTGATGSGLGYGLNPSYGSFVGTEIDAVCGVILTKFSNLEFGYGHFFRGAYIEDTFSKSGSQDADWIYTQLLVRF